jgi:vacuolar-type H+-ATPase catalytic subunit A/Vma1
LTSVFSRSDFATNTAYSSPFHSKSSTKENKMQFDMKESIDNLYAVVAGGTVAMPGAVVNMAGVQ